MLAKENAERRSRAVMELAGDGVGVKGGESDTVKNETVEVGNRWVQDEAKTSGSSNVQHGFDAPLHCPTDPRAIDINRLENCKQGCE